MKPIKTIKFAYDRLRSMDMVCCAGRSPFAAITRLVTAGWKRKLDHSVSVHTGLVFSLEGQFLIAEMQFDGLRLQSLECYNRAGGRRWVISIRRNETFDDPIHRCDAQRLIARDLRYGLDYDPKGLVEFVFNRVEDDKKRAYCSEYVYQVTKISGVSYPVAFRRAVSPFDLQVCANGWTNVMGWMRR